MKKQNFFTIIIFWVIATACSSVPSTVSKVDQLATIVAGTLTAQPPVTFTPIPTFTPVLVPTDTASPAPAAVNGPYYIFTRSQNVNLRVQPGTLFQVSRVMAQGSRLKVLSVSAGNEWAYVQNDEGVNGWVDIRFVDEFPLTQFPIVAPNDVQIVRGQVLDVNGLPVSGIGFAFEQNDASKSLRTDVTTDVNGIFYAYLPKNMSGTWTVSFISIASTSNTMTAECTANSADCGQTQPVSVSVILPTDVQLEFVFGMK